MINGQESYDKWTEEVEDAIKQLQKTVRKKPKERQGSCRR